MTPLNPDRQEAQAWAIQELARREYAAKRPSLLQRLVSWLFEHLQRLPLPDGPGTGLGVGVVLLLIAAGIGYAFYRSGGLLRESRSAGPGQLFDGRTLTAADHRAAAERAAAERQWRTSVIERFRAIVRELEERAVLTPQPGRTADEAARDAGAWFDDLAEELREGARLFDDVLYGDQPGTAASHNTLQTLDERVQMARPLAPAGVTATGPVVPS